MKCMIIVKANHSTEAGVMPTDDLLQQMGEYNASMVRAGVFLDGAGLKPSRDGARISFSEGRPLVSDGPFAETHEILAGFTIIETETYEEALDWVKKWPVECTDGKAELELRPLYGFDDFAPGSGLDVHKEYAQTLARQPSSAVAYLPFADGQCREAFEFYAECLGGEIEQMLAWGDMGMPDLPESQRSLLAHASLRMGKCQLAGVDLIREESAEKTGGNVVLGFTSPEKTKAACHALSAGGTVTMQPAATSWSSCFAVLTDRYGVHWMLNCEQPPESPGN